LTADAVRMSLNRWLLATAVLALGVATDPARAGPAGDPAMRAASRTPSVDAIAYRRCLWRDGRRYCPPYIGARVHGFRSPSSDYYEHEADKLPFGTRRWRDQMRRENRLGNPGS
jgi:hypothetical protein